MDLHKEKESVSLDPFVGSDTVSDSGKKRCADCRTKKTPLWRAGPCGPKSLCNACGLRFKKRREGMRIKEKLALKKQRKSDLLELKQEQQVLGEEELAAFTLMAFSRGTFQFRENNAEDSDDHFF